MTAATGAAMTTTRGNRSGLPHAHQSSTARDDTTNGFSRLRMARQGSIAHALLDLKTLGGIPLGLGNGFVGVCRHELKYHAPW